LYIKSKSVFLFSQIFGYNKMTTTHAKLNKYNPAISGGKSRQVAKKGRQASQ